MLEIEADNTPLFFNHPEITEPFDDVVEEWCFNKPYTKFGGRKSARSMAALLCFFESILERLYIPMISDSSVADLSSMIVTVPYKWAKKPFIDYIGDSFYFRSAEKELVFQLENTAWRMFFDMEIASKSPLGGVTLLAWKWDGSYVLPSKSFPFSYSVAIDHVEETETIGWTSAGGYWGRRAGNGSIDNAIAFIFSSKFFVDTTVNEKSLNFGEYVDKASVLLSYEYKTGLQRHAIELERDEEKGVNLIKKIPDRCAYLPYALTQVMVSAMKYLAFTTSFKESFRIKREYCYGNWVYGFEPGTFKPKYEGGWDTWETAEEFDSDIYYDSASKYLDSLGFVLRFNQVTYLTAESAMSSDEVNRLPLSEDGQYRVRTLGKGIFAFINFTGDPEAFQPVETPYERVVLDYEYVLKPNHDRCEGPKGWPAKEPANVGGIRFTHIDDIDHISMSGVRARYIEYYNSEYRICPNRTSHYDGFDFSESAANHANDMMAIAQRFGVSRPVKDNPRMERLEELIEERWSKVALLYSNNPVEGEANYPVAVRGINDVPFQWNAETGDWESLLEVNYGDFDSAIVFGDGYSESTAVENKGVIGIADFEFKHLNRVDSDDSQQS